MKRDTSESLNKAVYETYSTASDFLSLTITVTRGPCAIESVTRGQCVPRPTVTFRVHRAGVHNLLPAYLMENCQLVSVTGHRNDCVRRTPTCAYCSELTHVLAIAHLLLLDLEYGTVCQPSCESQTLHSNNFDEHSKRIYLVTGGCSAE